MNVIERFLRYVSFDTQSAEDSDTVPTTAKQKLLGAALAPLAVLFIPMGWLYGYVLLMGLAGFSILAYIQARILLRRVWPPENGDEAL